MFVSFARHTRGQGTEKTGMPMTPSRCSVEPVSPSASEYAFQRLRCPSIVMVQPTQDRIREHLARLVQRRCRKHRRLRNPLPKPLMRAGLMKVQDIVLEKAVELLFMQDQDVIQAFSSHASQKAFTDSICSWRSIRRSKHLDATRCCDACETRPECAIIIPNEICWRLPIRSRLPQRYALPRDPSAIASHSHESPCATSVR
jgi:hypothetical protein